MNWSIFVLSIIVFISSVTSWTVFPLSNKPKEASSVESVPFVTSNAPAPPSRLPLPVPLSISSFNKPTGVTQPAKDLLPPKGPIGILVPAKPFSSSASRIEPPSSDLLPPNEKVVPSSITTKLPLVSYTTTTYKPIVITTKKTITASPVKPTTVVNLLTPKIFFTNAVSQSPSELTAISDEDSSETVEEQTTMENIVKSTQETAINTTTAIRTTAAISSNDESGDINTEKEKLPVSETTAQPFTTAPLEPVSTTTPTVTSSSSSTLSVQSSTSQDESSSVETITSPPIVSSNATDTTVLTNLLTRVKPEIENSTPELITTLRISTTISPLVISSESEITVTTDAIKAEQPATDGLVPKAEDTITTTTSPTTTVVTPSASPLSEVPLTTVASHIVVPEVTKPSIELLPPKVTAVPTTPSFFLFEPIYVELVPPKEEYTYYNP